MMFIFIPMLDKNGWMKEKTTRRNENKSDKLAHVNLMRKFWEYFSRQKTETRCWDSPMSDKPCGMLRSNYNFDARLIKDWIVICNCLMI